MKIFLGQIGIGEKNAVFFLNEKKKLHNGHGVEAMFVKIAFGMEGGRGFEEPFADEDDQFFG